MRKFFIIQVLLVIVFMGRTQNLDSIALEIKNSYQKAIDSNKKEERLVFFEQFPRNFHVFHLLYGYDVFYELDEAEFVFYPLYNHAMDHIQLFFQTSKEVPFEVFCKKMVQLAQYGYYQADAHNYLIRCMQNFVENNLTAFILYIQNESSYEPHFWYFLISTSMYSNDLYIEWYEAFLSSVRKHDPLRAIVIEKIHESAKLLNLGY